MPELISVYFPTLSPKMFMGIVGAVLQRNSLTSYFFFLYLPPSIWAEIACCHCLFYSIALLPDMLMLLLSRFPNPLIILHFG